MAKLVGTFVIVVVASLGACSRTDTSTATSPSGGMCLDAGGACEHDAACCSGNCRVKDGMKTCSARPTAEEGTL